MAEAIRIEGLSEFRNNLRAMDRAFPKALRLAFNESADIIVQSARPRVRRKTGRAAGTVKVKSTQSYARVSGGGSKAPYYPWLDFGGHIAPRGRNIDRPFIKHGRYIYAAYDDSRGRFVEVMQRALVQVAEQAGIGVD